MKKTIVIFSGAGLSAESGIPTFRDSNGLWENYKVEDVASHEAWQDKKQLMLNFYAERFNRCKTVEPNLAHKSIAVLQDKFNVVNITQNVDDLLERAGCTDVTHLHGSLSKRKCEWHKDITNLDGDIQYQCDFKEDQLEPVKLGDLCPKCGGQLRPDIVWFGEAVNLDENKMQSLLVEMLSNRGIFICIGTSAQVYPAAGLLEYFKGLNRKFIVDLKPRPLGNYVLYEGNATEQMKELSDYLLATE